MVGRDMKFGRDDADGSGHRAGLLAWASGSGKWWCRRVATVDRLVSSKLLE
jgi:hypothetical protein